MIISRQGIGSRVNYNNITLKVKKDGDIGHLRQTTTVEKLDHSERIRCLGLYGIHGNDKGRR